MGVFFDQLDGKGNNLQYRDLVAGGNCQVPYCI